ncbi:hypothetical protein [Mycolicibacterium sp. XJ1819]
MASLEVTDYPLTDYDAMCYAFRQLNLQGWLGKISYGTRVGSNTPEYYMTVEKAGNSSTLYIGDVLKSIGGGVLMTEQQFNEAFNGGAL